MATDQGSKIIPSLTKAVNPNSSKPQYWQDPNNSGKPTSGDQVRVGAHYLQELLRAPTRNYSIVTTGKNYTIPKNSGNQIVQVKVYPIISDKNLTNQGLDQSGKPNAGNFGGDTRDIEVMVKAMPTIPEDGGNVNRTATMKDSIYGTTVDMGIYMKQTFKTLDVDPDNVDNRLQAAFDQEMFIAIVQLHAKCLLIDLLLSAGIVRYAGVATDFASMTGEKGSVPSIISHNLLKQLATTLHNKDAKMQTKMVTGVSLTDTKVIPACYLAYAPQELINVMEDMKDNLGRPAWVAVEHYAAGTSVYENEVGRIGNFRVIRMNWMPSYYGKGAEVTDNEAGASTSIHTSTSKETYDIFPFLVVTEDTFAQVSILYDSLKGKRVDQGGCKITVMNSTLGTVTDSDPFGRTFIKSAQWVYGFLAIYPERNAVIWSLGIK